MLEYDKFRKEHNPTYSDLKYEIEKKRREVRIEIIYGK